VIDNCILFLIAGFDTTSSALTLLSYHLMKNPSVQENIIKEIDEKLNGSEPDFDNINSLVYLEACIKESLRLEPSVVRIERKSVCDYKLGNIFVPKNTYITIPLKAVHRDPENFENPDDFKPERFLPENKDLIKSGTYLAFADGPRNCIGMRFALIEIKYCFAKLLKKYKLTESNDTKVCYLLKIITKLKIYCVLVLYNEIITIFYFIAS
jgi:cytochrome P450 family 3 subfamily A